MYKNTNVLKPYANEKYMKKIHKVGVTSVALSGQQTLVELHARSF